MHKHPGFLMHKNASLVSPGVKRRDESTGLNRDNK